MPAAAVFVTADFGVESLTGVVVLHFPALALIRYP